MKDDLLATFISNFEKFNKNEIDAIGALLGRESESAKRNSKLKKKNNSNSISI